MGLIELKPIISFTKNRRNSDVAISGAKAQGASLIAAAGEAGIGKTTTLQVKAANEEDLFLRYLTIFGKSGLDLLQALCRELGVFSPPGRRAPCFFEIVERLRGAERAVYIDEAHRMPQDLLNVVIDLSDATGCPFVLIGEEELLGVMQVNKRCWSRCYQVIEFQPLTLPEVIVYVRDATGLDLSAEVAAVLHKSSSGNFRLLKRAVYALVKFANSKGTREIDAELATLAVSVGMGGSKNGAKANARGRTGRMTS